MAVWDMAILAGTGLTLAVLAFALSAARVPASRGGHPLAWMTSRAGRCGTASRSRLGVG